MKIMYNKNTFKDTFIIYLLGRKITLMIAISQYQLVILQKKATYKGKQIQVNINNF